MAVTTEGPTTSAPRLPGPRRRLWVVGGVIVVALGLLLFQGLSNATVYFKTADEAVSQRASLGERRFRLEGMVVDGSVRRGGQDVDFTVRGERGGLVPVVHDGDVPELFAPGIPVVLEGRWDGTRYRSDRILVRHTSEYRAQNPDRVADYTTPSTQP
ncbi:MAG: cytochrome c maturation protein CcmE [Acidimicrobiales bacterium]